MPYIVSIEFPAKAGKVVQVLYFGRLPQVFLKPITKSSMSRESPVASTALSILATTLPITPSLKLFWWLRDKLPDSRYFFDFKFQAYSQNFTRPNYRAFRNPLLPFAFPLYLTALPFWVYTACCCLSDTKSDYAMKDFLLSEGCNHNKYHNKFF